MKLLFTILLISTTLFSSELKVEKLVQSTKSWDGTNLKNYPKGEPEITILKITIPAKTKLELHKHPVINAGVLLKGELTVTTVKDEVLELKAGDPIVEVVNKWHYGVNKGESDAVIVVFYAGVKGTPITVKK